MERAYPKQAWTDYMALARERARHNQPLYAKNELSQLLDHSLTQKQRRFDLRSSYTNVPAQSRAQRSFWQNICSIFGAPAVCR